MPGTENMRHGNFGDVVRKSQGDTTGLKSLCRGFNLFSWSGS